jgi:hypothetical protein
MRYPLAVGLQPSKRVMASVVIAHGAAALALFFALESRGQVAWAGIAVSARLVVLVVIALLAGSMLHALRREWAKRALHLVLADDGSVYCEHLANDVPFRLDRGAVDLGWAIWIRLRPEKIHRDRDEAQLALRKPVILMLVPSNVLPQGNWRALRIWLRHKAFAPRRA